MPGRKQLQLWHVLGRRARLQRALHRHFADEAVRGGVLHARLPLLSRRYAPSPRASVHALDERPPARGRLARPAGNELPRFRGDRLHRARARPGVQGHEGAHAPHPRRGRTGDRNSALSERRGGRDGKSGLPHAQPPLGHQCGAGVLLAAAGARGLPRAHRRLPARGH